MDRTNNERVAIIGMSCTLPEDINDADGLWNYCARGQSSASEIPASRFESKNFYHEDHSKRGHFNITAGSFLNQDVSAFDARFFNLNEAESTAMDPQQRLLLECTYRALENAGLDLDQLAGRSDVGVFAGASKSDYEDRMNQDPYTSSRYAATGNAMTMFANRLSYFLNIHGPSVTVDTACSSSLTALHLAVQSLQRGECSYAIVGGSFLQLSPTMLSNMGNLGTLSKDGKSYSFDHRAQGYGRGEAVSCIALRTEAQARNSGDPIRAIVRATGVNHGGRSPGITYPNGKAQESLIRDLYESIGLDPADTDYVEGHGTGTERGDPIEANAVLSVFRGEGHARSRPLFLGSIKSNFGHSEGASGILSVIKCVLMLENSVILPNANFDKLNPGIELNGCALEVPTQCVPWPRDALRRTSINNFGFGGSNAHVILEQAADFPLNAIDVDREHAHGLFVLSAKDADCLKLCMSELGQYLQEKEGHGDDTEFLRRLSYILCQRRTKFSYQWATCASTKAQLIKLLEAPPALNPAPKTLPIAFVFTGQGSQWARMGMTLMRWPAYSASMQESVRFIQEILGASWSLTDEISLLADESNINSPEISQPAVTALQIAILEVLRSWNIKPTAVCGHSSGEIAAAYAAGLVNSRAALALAFYRGKAAATLQTGPTSQFKGAMLAVGTSASEISPLIDSLTAGVASIACFNSLRSLTVSGDHAAIVELAQRLDERGIFNRMLKVNVAYHSLQVVPCARQYLKHIEPWLKACDSVQDAPIAFYSSVTGNKEVGSSVRSPWYWTTNLICPVQFAKASQVMMQDLVNDNRGKGMSAIEIGPHATLSGPLRETAKETLTQDLSFWYHPSMRRNDASTDGLLELATSLINSGVRLNERFWNTMPSIRGERLLTDLPSYPFNHSQGFWHSSRLADSHAFGGSPWHVLLGHKTTSSVGDSREYRNVFTLQDIPWLKDHCIHGAVVFPMAGYVSAAIEAVALENRDRKQGVEAYRIREMVIGKALILSDEQDNELFTVLRPRRFGTRVTSQTGGFDFTISSWNKAAGFVEHCSGIVSVLEKKAPNTVDDAAERSRTHFDNLRHSIRNRSKRMIDVNAMYRQAKQQGMEYGPAFRLMSSFWTGNDAARGMIATATPMEPEKQLIVHPTVLDAALHVGLCNLDSNPGRLAKLVAHVPTFVEEVYVSTAATSVSEPLEVYFHDPRTEDMCESTIGNLSCFGGSDPVIRIRNLRMKKMQQAKEELSVVESINPMEYKWLEHPDFWSDDILKKTRDDLPKTGTDILEELVDVEQVALRYMKQALQQSSFHPKESHVAKMKNWMSTILGEEELLEDHDDKVDISATTYCSSDMRFISSVGQELPSILAGEVDALSFLKQAGLDTIYEESKIFSHNAVFLAKAISQLALHKPDMKILEVGAGTGGFTKRIIDELTDALPRVPSRFAEYWYTDISPAFIGPAQARFEKWSSKMRYQTLDICSEPSVQGIDRGHFDLVIAADVIHATPSVQASLRNIRKLLRPGGSLALVELSRFSPFFMPFATLPGWWARPEGPILSRQEWRDELLEAGLAGCKAYVEDLEASGTHCLIWSHARHEVPDSPSGKTSIVSEDTDAALLCEQELARLGSNFDPTIYSSLVQIIDTDMRLSIVIEEAAKCSLLNPEPEQLEAIKYMCAKAEGILWVIWSSAEAIEDSAVAGLAFGFARTMRLEYRQLKLVVLNIVDTQELGAMAVVGRIFRHTFIDKPGRQETDVDLVWDMNSLLCPRLLPCESARSALSAFDEPSSPQLGEFWQDSRPLQLTMDRIGLIDSLHFSAAPRTLLEDRLGDDEVIIEIKATGLNFRDVLITLGRVPWTSPGKECSGVVVAAGCKARHRYQKGDRVVHLGDGLFATHARCITNTIAKIPDGTSLDFSEAASIPIIFCTAYESLVCRANLQPNERILIHAAAGGVGQAAIQIAQQLGAGIYCTVGSPEKKKFLIDHYKIDPSRIFSSRSTDFVEGLQSSTNGGVDVVLNSLSGDLLQASWKCVTPLGRFIDIGKRDALANSALEMAPFDKGVTYSAVQLDVLMLQRPDKTKHLLDTVMQRLAQGTWRPVHLAEKFSVEHLESAMRFMQSGKHIGKIVINNDRDARVPLRVMNAAKMSEIGIDGTYLLTGGTSGLASSLSKWLVDNGAKHVVLASRSGDVQSASAQDLIDYARTRGATVLMEKCDVGSPTQVAALLERIERRGSPEVRGVIHGAMVLKDAMFSSMTAEDFNAVLRPKVQGILNLYHALKSRDLDFFLCLSSVAAVVGNIGQAPYSAANGFMDHFCAWWSRHIDQKAISINLPSISDVGYVAEAIEAGMTAFSDKVYAASLSEEAVCKLMDAALQDNGKKSDSWGHRRSNNMVVGIPQVPALRSIIEEAGAAFSIMKHSMDALSREESHGSAVTSCDTTRRSVASQLSDVLEPAEKNSVIEANLRKRIAAITLRHPESIAPESAIADLGLDSLVTVELHSWILKELDARVTVMEIIGFQTFKQLVDIVCARSPLAVG